MLANSMHQFFKNKRVLVIDDCQVILNATRLMLVQHGCENQNVHFAKDAKSTLEACRNRQYDFMLVDYNLGDGSDGLQLLEQLRSENMLSKKTVVYVVTADQSRSIFYGFSEFEADGYLVKPVKIHAVVERLIASYKVKQLHIKIEKCFEDEGLEAALALCDNYQEHSSVRLLVAQLHLQVKDYVSAKKALVACIKDGDDNARLLLSEILFEQKLFDKAIALLTPLLKNKKLAFKAMQLQANCYLYSKQLVPAFDCFFELNSISDNSVSRLLIQYNLAQITQNTEVMINTARKIVNQLKNSIWFTVDLHLLTARAYLFAAEQTHDPAIKENLIHTVNKRIKFTEQAFKLSQYEWSRELLRARIDLLKGDNSRALGLLKTLDEHQDEMGFYNYSDVQLLAQKTHTDLSYSAHFHHDEHVKCSQMLLLEVTQKLHQRAEIALNEKRAQAHACTLKGESMQAVNLWFDIWHAEPHNHDNALSLIEAFTHAIPMDKPISTLRSAFLQAKMMVGQQPVIPSWFSDACESLEMTFNNLNQGQES